MGALGQAASDDPKFITMEQVARELIKDLLNFDIPVIGVKLGSMVPDSIEGVLVNVAAVALQKEFAEAIDVTKDEAHTDMVGFMLAQEVCKQMYNYGVIFNDDPDDDLQKKDDGLIWIMMVGSSWRDPGELAKFISNKLESIVTELTGVEPVAPPPDDDWFGDKKKMTDFEWQLAPQAEQIEISRAYADVEFQKGAPGVARPTGLPIVPIAIAGIAALFLLK
jgi:hypothetical protein